MVKIAGVVIVYYPDFSKLHFNIETYIDHIEKLFIVFNSPVSIKEINKLQSKYSKVQLILNKENLGIGSPLNQIAQTALNLGYEWLLTMDQDSYFQSGDYFEAFNRCNFKKVEIFSPFPVFSSDKKIENSDITEEILHVITSGNLLNLAIWRTIGGFEEKLFIDEVDNDYCLKAGLGGFKIISFKNIPLIHELGQIKEVYFLFKRYTIITRPPIRSYYVTRNNFYLFRKYKRAFPEFVRSRKKILLKAFIEILLFSTEKAENCRYAINGIRDYFHNSYGPYIGKTMKSNQQ
jgi:rhamnosyltransferase